jgi:DnaJ-class molecular chaperone
MKNYGNKIYNNSGNLIIEFKLMKNNDFNIDLKTLNLYSTQKISLEQSLCGISMSIKMPDNTIIKYHNDNIIIPNKLYEIKEIGIPRKINDTFKYTNLFIEFEIIYPNSFDKNIVNNLRKIFNITFNKQFGSHELFTINDNSTSDEHYNDNYNENHNEHKYEHNYEKVECNQQ